MALSQEVTKLVADLVSHHTGAVVSQGAGITMNYLRAEIQAVALDGVSGLAGVPFPDVQLAASATKELSSLISKPRPLPMCPCWLPVFDCFGSSIWHVAGFCKHVCMTLPARFLLLESVCVCGYYNSCLKTAVRDKDL